GFHALTGFEGTERTIYRVHEQIEVTVLHDLIVYLFLFIMMLDVRSLDGEEVVKYLIKNDNFVFYPLFRQLLRDIRDMSYDHLPVNQELLEQGIKKGLVNVANQIIQRFQNIPPSQNALSEGEKILNDLPSDRMTIDQLI